MIFFLLKEPRLLAIYYLLLLNDCDELPFLKEFRASAIPDRLTLANVSYYDGEEAIAALCEEAIAQAQTVTSYRTEPVKRIFRNYAHLKNGAWFTWGTTLEGDRGSVAYAKPSTARWVIEDGKLKKIKYETAPKCEARPILPYVDEETAAAIYKKFKVSPLPGETFWQVVCRCNLPVTITEGLKKALCLIAHGLPAIALRGITTWHKKGSAELHQAIAHFATKGRKIYIAFDQDTKPATVRDVRRQGLKLGNVLEGQDAKVFYLIWDPSEGKGVDDAIVAADDGQEWLNQAIAAAVTLNQYKRVGLRASALQTISQLNRLSFDVDRATEGEYLPELPQLILGAIHVLSASMYSGKTTRIGVDYVQWARSQGWLVLVLAPLNSLGKQTATDWGGLPHINDDLSTEELWERVREKGGIVMCPDSLPKLPLWFWDSPMLLILDEANQVLEHTFEGDTLGNRYDITLQKLNEVFQRAAAIVLSEDGIPDRAVRVTRAIAGEDRPVRVITHKKQGAVWDCTVSMGQASGYRARLLMETGEGRHLIVTSSQREARRLEKAYSKIHPSLGVVRIDSETNQKGQFKSFFEKPDDWLKDNLPDILILSPSAKSGVSIEGGIAAEDAYFAKVWGYFPALDTDEHMQHLGRYRPPVPRDIYVPQFILSSGDEAIANPYGIARRQRRNAAAIAKVHGLVALLDETRDESALRLEAAIADYLAESRAVSGAQKAIAHDALVARLEEAGHLVTCCKSGKDTPTIELWKQVQEEIWREDATAIASASPLQGHTSSWARKKLDSLDASREDRIVAHKVLWRDEFPGILFDDSEECYQALCKDFGAMRRGVLAQVAAENLESTKLSEQDAALSVLKAKVRSLHRLPRSYAKAWLLNKTGVLELLDGKAYRNGDPRAAAVKAAALRYSNEIFYWLRLQIKESQTEAEVCNKLLAKLGIDKQNGMLEVSRPGARGKQGDRVYRVNLAANPVRARLLEAARSKASEVVSTIREKEAIHNLQIVDTNLLHVHLPDLSHLPPEIGTTFAQLWAVAESWDERQEILRDIVSFEQREEAA